MRLLVSAAVLAVLLALVPIRQLAAALGGMSAGLWLIAVVLFLAGHVVGAYKWQLLLRHGGRIPTRTWLRAHFAGLAANLCLPGVAGGDLVRAAWIRRPVGNVEQVAVAGVVDRAVDCVALLVLATIGVVMTGATQSSRSVLIVAAVAMGALAMGTVVGIVLLRARSRRSGLLQRLVAAGALLAARPALPVACLALSLLVQTMFVLINRRLGSAVGVDVALAGWLVAWPLAKLVALAPVSLAGLGIREAALVAFLRPYGAPAALVTAAGLIWQSVLVAGGLVGWLAGSAAVARAQVPEDRAALEL